jgi:hypothetical protein
VIIFCGLVCNKSGLPAITCGNALGCGGPAQADPANATHPKPSVAAAAIFFMVAPALWPCNSSEDLSKPAEWQRQCNLLGIGQMKEFGKQKFGTSSRLKGIRSISNMMHRKLLIS